jgi:hypothetical protein
MPTGGEIQFWKGMLFQPLADHMYYVPVFSDDRQQGAFHHDFGDLHLFRSKFQVPGSKPLTWNLEPVTLYLSLA